jgi:hypothetical protein
MRIFHLECSLKTRKLKRGGKLSLCLPNQALSHEGVWGSGCIDPHFLYYASSWSSLISFKPRLLYPQGNSPLYPMDKRLDWPPEPVWTLLGKEESNPCRPTDSTSLYRLRHPDTHLFTCTFRTRFCKEVVVAPLPGYRLS